MHRMLEAINAHLSPPAREPGWQTAVGGMSSTHNVTRLELVETLEFEERKRVSMEADGAPIRERVEQAALVSQLASAVRGMTVTVSAYAVVSTYDPAGTFRPGAQVAWTGHLSLAEAERVRVLWEAHLNRPRDPFHVDYRAVPVYMMRKDGWTGPTR